MYNRSNRRHSKKYLGRKPIGIFLLLFLAFLLNIFLPALHVHGEELELDPSKCCRQSSHLHPKKGHDGHKEHDCLLCNHIYHSFSNQPRSSKLNIFYPIISDFCIEAEKDIFIFNDLLTSLQPEAP